MSAERAAQLEHTLDMLHTPVATCRRIAFLAGSDAAPVDEVMGWVRAALTAVPGRRVTLVADDRNADVALTAIKTDAPRDAVTAITGIMGAVTQHHALCVVAGGQRAEADPALALADLLGAHIPVVVALVDTGDVASHWARVHTARSRHAVLVKPRTRLARRASSLSRATLAARLLEAAHSQGVRA